jgi:aspartyl-tRNA synthetase
MQANLRLRHKLMRTIRRFLEDDEDFVEVRVCLASYWEHTVAV